MIKLLTPEESLQALRVHERGARNYAAMFSTWFGGIVTDPAVMVVPIDDHGFHRGDAVFEAVKCVDGRIYALDRHIDRMHVSAAHIALKMPFEFDVLREICIETVRASKCRDAILRMYVSRGPGGFTTNPYETVGSQFYLVITPFKPMPQAKYDKGATAKISAIKVKDGIFANVKSCNYLPNVLMKKEALDAGVDFTVSIDENGYLAEGSTENFAIVDEKGNFVVPGFERTLKGITVFRAMELAREAGLKTKEFGEVRHGQIKISDVMKAREAFFLGTTLDCISVTTFEGGPVGDGNVGPISRKLFSLLRADMEKGPLVTVA
ncbi:MAG: aminotransferase class IV [Bdellovibrionota bacterium]